MAMEFDGEPEEKDAQSDTQSSLDNDNDVNAESIVPSENEGTTDEEVKESEVTESVEENNLEEGKKELEAKKAEPERRKSLKFNEISIDDSLPILGIDEPEEQTLQQKLLSMHDKNLGKLGSVKAHALSIAIGLIIIMGLVFVFLELNGGNLVKDNRLVFELPSVSTTIFTEDGTQSYNVEVDLSVGINSSDAKEFNIDACYNVVYDIISDMTAEQFKDQNAQYLIKEEISDEFHKRTGDDVDIRIYVSDIEFKSSSTQLEK